MSTDHCRLFYSQRWDVMVMSTAQCRLLLGCDVYGSMKAILRSVLGCDGNVYGSMKAIVGM